MDYAICLYHLFVRTNLFIHLFICIIIIIIINFHFLMGTVFANGPGDLDSIPGRVIPKTLTMILDTSLLNTAGQILFNSIMIRNQTLA